MAKKGNDHHPNKAENVLLNFNMMLFCANINVLPRTQKAPEWMAVSSAYRRGHMQLRPPPNVFCVIQSPKFVLSVSWACFQL